MEALKNCMGAKGFKNKRSNDKGSSQVADPFYDHKRKSRHRLIGSLLFAVFVFIIVEIFFKENPDYFIKDLLVDVPNEERAKDKIVAEFRRLVSLLGRRLNEDDIRMIKQVNQRRWNVEIGSFLAKEKASTLQKKISKEGYDAKLRRKKIETIDVYTIKIGPLKLEAAEELRLLFLSRGFSVTLSR